MKKSFCFLLLTALTVVFMSTANVQASHVHVYSQHVKDGTYYQVQVGSHSHLYAYDPVTGAPIYRPCMIIEKRENCRLTCSCGQSVVCTEAHTVTVYHRWAY